MRLEHVGNAKITTTTAEIAVNALTILLTDATNWPTGNIGPFWVVVNKGLPTEEKILCSSRAGNTLQVWSDVSGNGRGGDDTVAQTHPLNSAVEHVWTAEEADAANAHIESGDGAHGYPPKLSIVVQSGTAESMSKVTVAGDQAEAEFRVRNVLISDSIPTASDGNDGDLWIVKAP